VTKSRFALLLTIFSALATPAPAQEIDAKPVVIDVTLADPPAAAKGYIRLMATKRDLAIGVMAGDLKTDTATIPRNAISVPTDATLKRGQPKDLLVQIDGIGQTGTYSGIFELTANDAKRPDDPPLQQTIAVTVKVVAVPKLALVGTQPVWTLVHCRWAATCWLADALLPPAMRGDAKMLHIEDQRSTTKTVVGQLFTTTGNGTETRATVKVDRDPAVPAGNQFKTTATFMRADLVPGVYPGVVQLQSDARGDLLSQAVSIDVRVGPLIALLAIVAGVFVGRFGQMLSTPLFQFQSGLLSRVYQLQGPAGQLKDTALRTLILERLKHAIDKIELAAAVDPGLTAEVEGMAAQTVVAERFDRVEALVSGVTDHAKRDALQKRLDGIRPLILTADLKNADTQMDAVETDATPPGARAMLPLGTTGATAGTGTLAAPKRIADADIPLLVRALRLLAGTSGPISASAKFASVRPLLFLVLLVVLCLTGFNTLYVKAPAGFGSAGLFDQLGLFMWGLTADVAQGTLQRLPK
jgi:hypothetical protein